MLVSSIGGGVLILIILSSYTSTSLRLCGNTGKGKEKKGINQHCSLHLVAFHPIIIPATHACYALFAKEKMARSILFVFVVFRDTNIHVKHFVIMDLIAFIR